VHNIQSTYNGGGVNPSPFYLFRKGKNMKKKILILTALFIFAFTTFAFAFDQVQYDTLYNTHKAEYPYIVSYRTTYGARYLLTNKPVFYNTSRNQLDIQGFKGLLYGDDGLQQMWTINSNNYFSFTHFNASNHDVYNVDSSGVFFSLPRPKIPLTVNQAVAMIPVQIFLIVLGLIVGSLAFRKAWTMLLTQLRGA